MFDLAFSSEPIRRDGKTEPVYYTGLKVNRPPADLTLDLTFE